MTFDCADFIYSLTRVTVGHRFIASLAVRGWSPSTYSTPLALVDTPSSLTDVSQPSITATSDSGKKPLIFTFIYHGFEINRKQIMAVYVSAKRYPQMYTVFIHPFLCYNCDKDFLL